MNLDSDRLNRWLTLGANIGVLVGIILLIVELDQNREAVQAQTRAALSQGIVDHMSLIAGNAELANLRRRIDGGENATEDEQYRYELITRALVRYWENVHYQYRQGLYDDAEFAAHREAIRDYFAYSKAIVAFWCTSRHGMSREFVKEIDGLIANHGCTNH
jgi:hypothetical protein